MTDALQVPCPWCGAGTGEPCQVRAAHPTTGRAILLDVEPHADRIAVSS